MHGHTYVFDRCMNMIYMRCKKVFIEFMLRMRLSQISV